MTDTKQNLRLTDEQTSATFKARWGSDAMTRFWDLKDNPRYIPRYVDGFLEDLLNELEALAHGVVPSQLEENDFFLNPDKAWKPKA